MIEIIRSLENCLALNIPCVVVTVTEVKGSAPGKVGFKMLIGSNGRINGTIGGGSAELYAIEKSKELILSGKKFLTETLSMNESSESSNKRGKHTNGKNIMLNSLCGGEVTLFFEVYQKYRTIHLFGAGHVAQALTKAAIELNYFINIYDNREDILNEIADSTACRKIKTDLSGLPEAENDIILIGKDDFIVIATHNHLNDFDVLEYLYKNYRGLKYIGMIGSKRKVAEGLAYIKKKFGEEIDLSNLYAPVGLDIGGETHSEIALSIIAEIQAVRYGKTINHLRSNG